MKKLISVLLLGLIIISVVSSCESSKYSVWRSKHSEFYSIACFSVPFVSGDFDWDQAEELEKDSYGRIMFKYSSNSKMLYDYCGEKLQAIVICQKYDDKYSYYYDNYSFVYLQNNGSVSDKYIETLKSWNDWNQPLDESKMSKVENSFSPYKYDIPYNVNAIDSISEELANDTISKSNNIQYECDTLAVDEYKRRLYVVREYSVNDNNEYIFYSAYFALCDENLQLLFENGEPCILKIEDIVNCQDDLKTIKERYNWNEPR